MPEREGVKRSVAVPNVDCDEPKRRSCCLRDGLPRRAVAAGFGLEAVVSRVAEGLGESAEYSWRQQRMDGGAKAKLWAPSVRGGSSGLSFGSMPDMGCAGRRTRSVRPGSA
jgi:hypothetical protein